MGTENEKFLSLEELREVLDYNPETGKFTWKKRISDKCPVGVSAGSIRNGRITITIYKRRYHASRLAFAMCYGRWADGQIDHINRDPLDNRIINLREATHSQNLANTKRRTDNTTGYKGVTYIARIKRFQAQLWAKNQKYNLGYYLSAEEAYEVYLAKAKELFGEFHYAGELNG